MSWQDRDYNRESALGMPGQPRGNAAWSLTTWLIIVNTVIFLLDMMLGPWMHGGKGLGPLTQYGAFQRVTAVQHLELWRWISYQFLHADPMHILFNMIALHFFGRIMENWWGRRRFLAFYLLCGMSGAWLYAVLSYMHWLNAGPMSMLVGASGSIFGILVGCAMVAPDLKVMLLFPPIPMKMRTMAMVVLGIAVFMVLFLGHDPNSNAGGEAAHLGGALLGFLLVRNRASLDWADRLAIGQQSGRRSAATPGTKKSDWFAKQEKLRKQQEMLDEQVDRILAKVKEQGLHSLTENEKRILLEATEHQRREEE